ncbi:hypothetical protein OROGR_024814 [Orobanche gracilis]
MAKTDLIFRILITAAVLAACFLLTIADAGGYSRWTPMNNPATCQGSIAECMADGTGEIDMDSEVSRRMLATHGKDYVSYGALDPGGIPCSRHGSSYYNCDPKSKGAVNPYIRKCSAVTKCRK